MGRARDEGTKAIERMLRSPKDYTLNQMIDWYKDSRKENKKLKAEIDRYREALMQIRLSKSLSVTIGIAGEALEDGE